MITSLDYKKYCILFTQNVIKKIHLFTAGACCQFGSRVKWISSQLFLPNGAEGLLKYLDQMKYRWPKRQNLILSIMVALKYHYMAGNSLLQYIVQFKIKSCQILFIFKNDFFLWAVYYCHMYMIATCVLLSHEISSINWICYYLISVTSAKIYSFLFSVILFPAYFSFVHSNYNSSIFIFSS